jgi:hypothetical protein
MTTTISASGLPTVRCIATSVFRSNPTEVAGYLGGLHQALRDLTA